MKCIKIAVTSVILLSFSNLTFATGSKVVSCEKAATYINKLDYGNATGQESSACHKTQEWQRLGTQWNDDKASASETDLSTNDGVSWKTSTDGGNTWVDNGELTTGGLVKFQFDITRKTTGNHKYDLLKSWVDWNQDGSWSEDESIITQKWWKNEDSEGNATNGSKNHTLNKNYDLSTWADLGTDGSQNRNNNWWRNNKDRWNKSIFNSDDTTATFFSEAITINNLNITQDIWLRARVVCENSLENHSDNMNLLATGYQDQGEVEDYKLTIAKKPVDVPEPSTLFLFALGLLAITYRQKSALKK